MKNNILFLPACIAPFNNVLNLTRVNHEDRIKDHYKALNFWLNNYPYLHILFVDNSNFPKDELAKYVPLIDRVEYLTYDGRSDSVQKGTGRGEIEIFNYAYENSNTFREAKLIIKCSARYTFKGISKFYDHNHSDYDLIGNFKLNLSFMDARVFAFKPFFFKEFFYRQGVLVDESKDFLFEHALACAAHELLVDKKNKWKNIPFPLIVNGISGKGPNVKYNSFFRKLLTKINYYRLLTHVNDKL